MMTIMKDNSAAILNGFNPRISIWILIALINKQRVAFIYENTWEEILVCYTLERKGNGKTGRGDIFWGLPWIPSTRYSSDHPLWTDITQDKAATLDILYLLDSRWRYINSIVFGGTVRISTTNHAIPQLSTT